MRFYLAPMEGITTYIYRNAYHKYYGCIDTYYTPFVANRRLKSRELADVSPDNNKALPLVPQILTNQADVFLEITSQLYDMGYDEVNLNLGCPSGTVVRFPSKQGLELIHYMNGKICLKCTNVFQSKN